MACLGLAFLSACGQAYDIASNRNSALVMPEKHIDGDIQANKPPNSGGGGSVVGATSVNPSPSPSGEGWEPVPSPSPAASPSASPASSPVASPSPVMSPNPVASPSPAMSPSPAASPNPQDPLSKYSCGNKNEKKVLICHRPQGNPAAAHDICVSIQGAIHGHGIDLNSGVSTTGDSLGSCNSP